MSGGQQRRPGRTFPLHELHPSIALYGLLTGGLAAWLRSLHPQTHSPQPQQRAGPNGGHDLGNVLLLLQLDSTLFKFVVIDEDEGVLVEGS